MCNQRTHKIIIILLLIIACAVWFIPLHAWFKVAASWLCIAAIILMVLRRLFVGNDEDYREAEYPRKYREDVIEWEDGWW